MDNTFYRDTLKAKKIKLIDALNVLGNNIALKIKEKNNVINALKQETKDTSVDEKYKTDKNKELDNLKLELNNILKDIDNIINDVTT